MTDIPTESWTAELIKADLVFVNSEPADCGCTMRFSDGEGVYSDITYIFFCSKHKKEVIPNEAEV